MKDLLSIEQALWDLAAQREGVGLATLLGASPGRRGTRGRSIVEA
jgi:L-alanine-DL-glutamate epimerase-like enolase superfamily enzyme